MKYPCTLSFVFALLFMSSAYGQKFLTKPYKEWSQTEAIKVASDSPWATQYQSEQGLDQAAIEQQRRDQADTRLSGRDRGNLGRPEVPVPIVVQLHSALPVRQAIVRLQQINAGYDTMNADARKKFDESTAKFLSCAICKEYYVVTIRKWKDTSNAVSEGIFQAMKLEDLKGKIWLVNDKDQKLELTQFTAPKGSAESAVFFFKRNNEKGEPFFTAADKQVRLVFASELRDNSNAYSKLIPRAFEFKTSKMVVDGALQF